MTLECGFTADFTNFLKSNGKIYLILKVIQAGVLIDQILNVQIMEEEIHLLKKSKKLPLFLFTETVT